MFESHKQVGARNMISTAPVDPEIKPESFLGVVSDRAACPAGCSCKEAGGARGGATFKHLIITGELHGY
jgi:hypothetical protein